MTAILSSLRNSFFAISNKCCIHFNYSNLWTFLNSCQLCMVVSVVRSPKKTQNKTRFDSGFLSRLHKFDKNSQLLCCVLSKGQSNYVGDFGKLLLPSQKTWTMYKIWQKNYNFKKILIFLKQTLLFTYLRDFSQWYSLFKETIYLGPWL